MSIDLTEYENPVDLRPLTLDDLDALVALQRACFPTMPPWAHEHLASQLEQWDQSQLGLFIDDRLVASCAQLIIDQSEYATLADWHDVADGGFIRNHDPEGDTLYGIEIQVHPDYQGRRLSRRLYDARKDLCRKLGLSRMVVGGRIPGYAKHKDRLTAGKYVEEVQAKHLFDPVLTAQLANGFLLRELVPDYLPSDEDSAGFATFMEWPNLDFIKPRSKRQLRAVQPVRVGVVQYQMRPIERFEDFERQVKFFVDTGSDYQCDFLLFPELFTLQLLSLVPESRPGTAARELARFTPRYLELFNELAVRYNVNIIGGSQFTLQGDDLYNNAYLFRRDGTIDSQSKIHVTPSEARWWGVKGGNEVKTFETDRGRIAILICYDVEFPELARKITADGARLLFVPYNTNDRYGHNRVRVCAQARCVENHLFTVMAGCVGNLPFVENADVHYARSAVLSPSDMEFARDGIAAEAEPGLETVLAHDLDLEQLRRHRRRGTVQCWNDRRKDLYKVTFGDQDI